MDIFFEVLKFIGVYLIWNCNAYFMHRLGHLRSKYNIFYKIHIAHHKRKYNAKSHVENVKITPATFVLWFGTFKETIDVWIVLFIPAVILAFIFGGSAWLLVFLVYFYEVFLSEGRLDHNPYLVNKFILKYFAWGQQHLEHHRDVAVNFGFHFMLYDFLFRTYKKAKFKELT